MTSGSSRMVRIGGDDFGIVGNGPNRQESLRRVRIIKNCRECLTSSLALVVWHWWWFESESVGAEIKLQNRREWVHIGVGCQNCRKWVRNSWVGFVVIGNGWVCGYRRQLGYLGAVLFRS